MLKLVTIVIGVLVLGVAPTFAASSYYVAHSPKSTACSVLEKKPDGKKMIAVGRSHKTQAQAEAAMKAAKACGY
jgi:hypothetical protein